MLLQNLFQQPLEQFERYDTNQIAQYPQALAKLVEFLSSPAGGAVAGGGLAAIITGFAANAWQNRQANIFPVVFSGAEQIGRAEQNTATRFYSSVNDLAMTVTQAWNAARRQRSYEIFTQQLKNSDALSLARNVEAEGSRLLQELDSHQKLGSHAGDATSALKESWDYSSHDKYISIPVKSGKVTTYHQVYTGTDHYFTFQRDQAVTAGERLTALLQGFPHRELYDPRFGQLSIAPDVSHRESVRDTIFEDGSRQVTDEEARQFVNQWVKRAYAEAALQKVSGLLAKLDEIAPNAMKIILASDKDYHYHTGSRSHSGPDGYRSSKRLWTRCESIHDNIAGLLDSVNEAVANAQELQKMVDRTYIPGPMKHRHLASNAMDLAVESYLASFPDSEIKMDQRVKHGASAGIALLLGAGLGAAIYFLHPSSNFF